MDWRKLEFREVSAYRRVSERPERLGGMQQDHKCQDVGSFVGVTVDTVQEVIKTALVVKSVG